MREQLKTSTTLTVQVSCSIIIYSLYGSSIVGMRREMNVVSVAAFDLDLLVETLQKLKEGRHVEIPVYDFSTHARAKYKVTYTYNVHVSVCV